VHNTEICFFPYTCHQYIVNEKYGAGTVKSWQQICYLSISVYFNSLLNLVRQFS